MTDKNLRNIGPYAIALIFVVIFTFVKLMLILERDPLVSFYIFPAVGFFLPFLLKYKIPTWSVVLSFILGPTFLTNELSIFSVSSGIFMIIELFALKWIIEKTENTGQLILKEYTDLKGIVWIGLTAFILGGFASLFFYTFKHHHTYHSLDFFIGFGLSHLASILIPLPVLVEFIKAKKRGALKDFFKIPILVLILNLIIIAAFISNLLDVRFIFLAFISIALTTLFVDRIKTYTITFLYMLGIASTDPTFLGAFASADLGIVMCLYGIILVVFQLMAVIFIQISEASISKRQYYFLFAIFISLTATSMKVFESEAETNLNHTLAISEDITREFEERGMRINQVINLGEAYLNANPNPKIENAEKYFSLLEHEISYSGLLGVGYIYKIPISEKNEFTKNAQNYFGNGYQIKNIPSTTETPSSFFSFPIGMIFPLKKNYGALGFDMATEENRKFAIESALNSSSPYSTELIQLIQDRVQRKGFIVYKKIASCDEEQKQKNYFFPCLISVPVIIDSLMNEIIKEVLNKGEHDLFVRVIHNDGTKDEEFFSNLIEDKVNYWIKPVETAVRLHNHKLTFQIYNGGDFHSDSTASFIQTMILYSAIIILFGRILISTILAERRASLIAEDMSIKMTRSAKQAALGEMASGVAHEINNPLTIIRGTCEKIQILSRKGPLDQEKILMDIKKISDTSERISKIIKGLKSLARNADNDPMIPCDLKTVVSESLEVCRERFKRNDVDLKVTIPGNPLNVSGRAAQLGQVIVNCLNNAFDAVASKEEHPWVHLELKELKVGSDDLIEISITDSGLGIPPEIREKLFQPFFTTKEVGHGTGLGLSISQRIVKEHGGEFLYDEQSQNTKFYFRLKRI